MVRERCVLLRIKHLEQRACRITVIGSRKLIHLIQYHDRIGYPALLDSIHDTARHGSDIGPSVAADIRFIPYTAQGNTHILAPHRLGNCLSDAGLAGTGSSDKEQDGTGLLMPQIHHGNLLNNPVLYVAQAKMVLVQNPLSFIQINFFRRLLFPLETRDKIQIIIEHAGFRTVLVFLLHPVEHLACFALCGLIHAAFIDLHLEPAYV